MISTRLIGNWIKRVINSEIGDIVLRMSYRFLRSSIAGDGESKGLIYSMTYEPGNQTYECQPLSMQIQREMDLISIILIYF